MNLPRGDMARKLQLFVIAVPLGKILPTTPILLPECHSFME